MVIGRPVAAQMQLHAKVRAKSAARETGRREARKGGSSRRRDGAPAGAHSPRKRVPAERQHPRRSAVRRSVPFGLAGGGNNKPAAPGRKQQGRFRTPADCIAEPAAPPPYCGNLMPPRGYL